MSVDSFSDEYFPCGNPPGKREKIKVHDFVPPTDMEPKEISLQSDGELVFRVILKSGSAVSILWAGNKNTAYGAIWRREPIKYVNDIHGSGNVLMNAYFRGEDVTEDVLRLAKHVNFSEEYIPGIIEQQSKSRDKRKV